MVQFLIWIIPTLNILWLAWAWWRTGHLHNPRPWRVFLAVFFTFVMLHLAWLFYARASDNTVPLLPTSMSIAYVWHLLVLIPLSAVILLAESFSGIFHLFRRRSKIPASIDKIPPSGNGFPVPDEKLAHKEPLNSTLTRRDFLRAAAITAPPALTIISGVAGYDLAKRFRVRHIDVDLPGLPPELDGATIAHLSDVHAGKFVDEKLLRKIASATNDLRADVILATGDLIDYSLTDLPNALDAAKRLDAPGGVFMCEGNHDLFQSRKIFEETVRASGVGLLVNESRLCNLRGHQVQILGLRWGIGDSPHDPTPDHPAERSTENWQPPRDDAGATVHLANMKANLDPEAVSIVLAHHPHAFDAAAENNLALTLAGHTHGGQLMLSENVGFGPAMYRYWSGLYKKGNSRLVVSNGIGNWLPLRINAPAELIHITLRRAG